MEGSTSTRKTILKIQRQRSNSQIFPIYLTGKPMPIDNEEIVSAETNEQNKDGFPSGTTEGEPLKLWHYRGTATMALHSVSPTTSIAEAPSQPDKNMKGQTSGNTEGVGGDSHYGNT